MEQLEQVKTSMPPPQIPGYSMKCGAMEAGAQQVPTDVPLAKKPRHSREVETPAECSGLESTPPFDAPVPAHQPAANPVTIWEDCRQQLMKELEAAGQTWAVEWQQLQEDETAAMAAIHDLNKSARETNICFHQQLDSLHNTVVDVVSYFKK